MRSALTLLFLGLLGFYGFTAHGYLENTDADVTMHAARALYLRGDPGLLATGDDTSAAERVIATEKGVPRYGMAGANGKYYVWFPIGHQLLMVPCVALGELFAGWFPEVEAAYIERNQPVFGEFYWARFFASFLPVLSAAGATVMVLLLSMALGCRAGEALLVTAAAVLCTQFWPAASETMSDGPGGFFLLAMAALVFRVRARLGGLGSAFLAGVCGGWAVLVRYPHALPVAVLAAVAVHTAVRDRSWPHLVALGIGALPEAIGLLVANWLRFESLTETGYSAGATSTWWNFPSYLGIPAILIAPGKGVLWFSLPLWLALPSFFGRSALHFPRLPALLIFVLPLILYGHTAGWAAGQCWSVRYLTPSIVLLVAVALSCSKPWVRHPRWFAAVCLLGLAVSLGGVLTPYRGQQDLARRAALVTYGEVPHLDNNINSDPRLSPVHSHWTYAYLSATGRLERGGPENTTGPMFGVHEQGPHPARLHRPHEDAGFRHWWMVFLHHHHGFPIWPVGIAWWLATGALLFLGVRRLRHSSVAYS